MDNLENIRYFWTFWKFLEVCGLLRVFLVVHWTFFEKKLNFFGIFVWKIDIPEVRITVVQCHTGKKSAGGSNFPLSLVQWKFEHFAPKSSTRPPDQIEVCLYMHYSCKDHFCQDLVARAQYSAHGHSILASAPCDKLNFTKAEMSTLLYVLRLSLLASPSCI